MIPKIIHYAWLGDQSKKPIERINSWKNVLRDYEFKEWSETNIDLEEYRFARAAYDLGRYGPALDLYRASFLYDYGGIWLDTDVIVHEDLAPFLEYSFFIGYETPGFLNLGTIGAEPHHPIFGKVKRWFHETSDNATITERNYLRLIMEKINCSRAILGALRSLYGFIPNSQSMTIQDRVRLEAVPTFTLRGDYGMKNYTEHLFEGSWRPGVNIDWIEMLRNSWEKNISPGYYKI